MTKLLIRLFVSDYKEKESISVRTRYGILVSVIGIIANVILCLTKLVIGYLISSISVMSDGFNNLSDAASSVISFIGTKVSVRPADKEHPFGHGRAEYISAFIVSFLILQVGFTCMKNSIDKIIHPESVSYNSIMVGILVLSVAVKVWLGMFNRTIGKEINSPVMLATAQDAFGDVLITSTTIIAIFVGKFTGLMVDGYMGVIISAFVLYNGIKIAKETMEPLLGEAIDKDIYSQIIRTVNEYEDVIGAHDLIIHNYGPQKAMATLHVEFPNTITIEDAHTIVDKIESDILRDMGIHIVIHVDPVDVLDEEYTTIREKVIAIVKSLEDKASIHDFRIVRERDEVRLIFDMVLPFHYKQVDSDLLVGKISEKVKEIDITYRCNITTEHGFVSE